MTILIVLGVVLIVAIVVLVFNVVVERRDEEAREPERWADRHGLDLTDVSRPWVAAYLRTGRNLRQVCGFGGLVVAASVTAATGLDLYVSGLVWVLLGYLVGCLWAELALTRVPTGTRRAASLVTRRLGDYLPRRMQIAEVVVALTALGLGAVVVLTHFETRLRSLAPGVPPPSGFHLVSPDATDQIVRQGALAASVMAPMIIGVVWLAQRYLIGRPQPVVDPSLIAADDAFRSSSTHLLGGSGLAAGCLLIGSQLGYLTTVTSGRVQTAVIIALVASFAAAWVLFRWRNGPWQVRHPVIVAASAPIAPPGAVDAAAFPSGWSNPSPPAFRSASPPAVGTASTTAVAPAPTAEGVPDRAAPPWAIRRGPVPLAVSAIVLVALTGWALRAWGPINPAVTMSNAQQSIDGYGAWTVSVLVQNEAAASIEIVGASTTVEPLTGSNGVTSGEITEVTVAEASYDGRPAPWSRPIPAPIAGHRWGLVTVALSSNPDCAPGIGLLTFDLGITYRTESGRRVTTVVNVPRADLPACISPLPTGTPPADEVTAEAAVRSAFATVYDPAGGSARLDLIDDPRGVADTTAAALAGPYGSQVAASTATIGEISFDRPDHAWFHYELSAGFGTRTGESSLVDGQWKIARSTVCADLALASVTCPPLPG